MLISIVSPELLAMAQLKRNAMRADPYRFFRTDKDKWVTHASDLGGRLEAIKSMISLGEKMLCDMTAEKIWLASLTVPGRPN